MGSVHGVRVLDRSRGQSRQPSALRCTCPPLATARRTARGHAQPEYSRKRIRITTPAPPCRWPAQHVRSVSCNGQASRSTTPARSATHSLRYLTQVDAVIPVLLLVHALLDTRTPLRWLVSWTDDSYRCLGRPEGSSQNARGITMAMTLTIDLDWQRWHRDVHEAGISAARYEHGLHSTVMCKGRSSGLTVSGSVRETAVDTLGGTHLFAAYGSEYKDSLSIVLAGPDWCTREQATLAVPYAKDALHDLVSLPPNRLSFRFFTRWLMRPTVYDEPRCALPLNALGFAVHRPLQRRRWFRLTTA